MEVIKNYVYWIYNEECVSPETCGYIGVTYDPDSRFRSHQKKNKKIPNDRKSETIAATRTLKVVAFFQNKATKNMTKIPGVKNPVKFWIY